jgi:bifunctional non-homologous end joining protein LigD
VTALGSLDERARASLPPGRAEFVAPMLATLTDDRFSDPNWMFERKLDGVRAVAVRDDAGAELYSRNRQRMGRTYPELREALEQQLPPGVVADGEIVAFDGAQTSFTRLQGRIGITDPDRARATGIAVSLYLFDLLVVDGHDVAGLPLRTRKQLLREVAAWGDPIRLSTHRNAAGEAFFRDACARGWEGLIAKRADAPYRPGRRTDSWLKLKCTHEQELVIGGWTDPEGSRSGFGALLVGYREGSALRYAGKVGTGFDERTLGALSARLRELSARSSPFADRVRAQGAHWIRPELVAQVGFSEWTRDGKLRHPRYLGLREDKDPADVVREQASR